MLGLSLLLHIAIIAFVPGFGIFLPSGDVPFIEIETILLSPESGEEPGSEVDSESVLGEFAVQPEFTVSEPGRIERSDTIDEWERTIFDHEAQPPEIPKTDALPRKRSSIDPEALTVQVESRLPVSKPAFDQPDNFERLDPVKADEVTQNAEQPFDIAMLRGEEEPPVETEPEFKGRELPEIPENRASLQPVTFDLASRELPKSPVETPVRAFRQRDDAVDIPELRLPERSVLPETEKESFALAHEEFHILRPAEALPAPDELPDLQLRPLPEISKTAVLAVVPERQSTELRPVIAAAAPSALQRDFRQKSVEKRLVPSFSRPEHSWPEGEDRVITALEMPQDSSEPPEERVVSSQEDEELVLPSILQNMVKTPPKAVLRSAVALNVARVETQPEARGSVRIRPELRVIEPQMPIPLTSAGGLERPAPPEREETILHEGPPKLRRPKVEATPTPGPLFSVKRATVLQEQAPPGAKPLPRLFPEPVTPRQERDALREFNPLTNRSFGSRRAGLLPVERETPLRFEDEKAVIEAGDDTLEEVETSEPEGEALELTIEGPASGRKVLYKPPQFPEVALEMEVNIRLKFWVLPDGSVGEVIPLQRGDVRLERAAIQYLKSWRFTHVANGRKVWGILPIRYTLR